MRRAYLIYIGLVASGGCVDGFSGSNVQIDLSPRTPPQASQGRTPGPDELPSNIHFRLYAVQEATGSDALFELQRFEIHKLVDVESPCFIDVGDHVPFPGLHVTQYGRRMAEATGISDIANPPPNATEQQKIDAATAIQRMSNIAELAGDEGLKVVSSASVAEYPPVDTICNGAGLPPAMCIDDASNARRLQICQDTWDADPALFEGTDRILTAPLNGTTFGFVVGVNPITPTPVGGAQFVVSDALRNIDEYAIFFQTDGVDEPGTLILSGRPQGTTRGVTHVHMDSPLLPTLVTAELAIFSSLDEDDVHF